MARPILPIPKPLPLQFRVTKLPPLRAAYLFRIQEEGARLQSESLGSYTRGCLAGAHRLEDNGPAWQAMRLSRNRHWAHPITIELIKKLATKSKEKDGWNGLLVGDLSMPRGGPMWPSHRSHQIGLDADVWLTPMPERRYSQREQENVSAKLMLTDDHLSVDYNFWTDAHYRLIKRAASFREVQRVFVHPAIKKELCESSEKDRTWLSKVRPVRGHNYHFHIRLRCPPGSGKCIPQREPKVNDGCGVELDNWYKWLHARLKQKYKNPENYKPSKSRYSWLTLDDMPFGCQAVLSSP
ncbi:MAG: penicillin-insensitive murein endopeptidase [Hyphomicrobiaceae bacterium]|nr:penicillin-insensitive murein endopeptidase [Hyphomicrobiaceae bacterium]